MWISHAGVAVDMSVNDNGQLSKVTVKNRTKRFKEKTRVAMTAQRTHQQPLLSGTTIEMQHTTG